MALPRDESGVQRLGKSWVLFRIADALVGMISGAELGKLRRFRFLPIKSKTKFDVTA
jgi:hypothetical protein